MGLHLEVGVVKYFVSSCNELQWNLLHLTNIKFLFKYGSVHSVLAYRECVCMRACVCVLKRHFITFIDSSSLSITCKLTISTIIKLRYSTNVVKIAFPCYCKPHAVFTIDMQVDMKKICLFVPRHHVDLPDPTINIVDNYHSLARLRSLSDLLVVCLPKVTMQSAGLKVMPPLQEIPITSVEGSLVGM